MTSIPRFPITNGADSIVGTNNADSIASLGGNDTINGLGGNDQLQGGSGNDTLIGWGGGANERDTLVGGAGADVFDVSSSYRDDGSALLLDFNPAEGDRLKLAHGQTYTYIGGGLATAINSNGALIAYINNFNVGTGDITSATPWVVI